MCRLQVEGRVAISRAIHLAKRFFQVLTARPLTPAEQDEVATLLRPEEADLFWSQQVADQRHGLDTARKVARRQPKDAALIRAGLLHDIGKSQSSLGAFSRTFATMAAIARLPMPNRYRRYIEHGPLGAAALRAAGAEPVVIAFAEHHPGQAPNGFDSVAWQVLLEADDD